MRYLITQTYQDKVSAIRDVPDSPLSEALVVQSPSQVRANDWI